MTTFQDPPLQSRRAVRQTERDGQPSAPSSTPEPLTYTTTNRPPMPEYDAPGLRTRRTPDALPPTEALPQAEPGTFRPRDFSPEGRRAASPSWAPEYGGATDDGAIEYHTQARVDAAPAPTEPVADQHDPIEQTLTRRELRALRDAHGITATTSADMLLPDVAAAPTAPTVEPAAPAVAAALSAPPVAPTPAVAPQPAPSSRLDSALAEFDALAGNRPATNPAIPTVRGRRAAPSPVPVDVAPRAEAPAAPLPLVEPVAQQPVAQQPVAQQPVAPQPAPPVYEAPVAQVVEQPVFEAPVAAPVTPTPVTELPAPTAESAAPAATDGLSAFEALFTPPSAAAAPVAEPVVEATIEPEPAPVMPQPVAQVEVASVVEAPVVEAPVFQAPVLQAPASPEPVAPVAQAPVADAPTQAPLPEVIADPSISAPPVGHWSTQADLDDETQQGSATLSGSVGANSAPLTTSALVLPNLPDDFGPLASGDVILTGSISLPHSFSQTGARPEQLDQSDLDHLLDPGDHQVASTDSSPVRAIKAVSTHTSSRNVLGTLKPKGNRGFTILIIAASGMAAVVVALLVVGMISGQL
jgi:hypothetical protein